LLLLLLYGAFSALVYKPLKATLGERRSRTEGAIEKARADIAVAEAKTLEYQEKLREARIAIFRAQEARRNQAQQTRAEVVAGARKQADELIRQTKAQLEAETAVARQRLQAESGRLAEAIIRAILQPAGKSEAPAAGGQ
jgi:F-type H+-transporting ATPase subunit b